MRVVIDANVFISALISSRGAPSQVIERWLQGQFDVLLTPPIVEELLRVTAYEKLQKYAGLRENRQEFVRLLSEQGIWVEPEETLAVVEVDESDNRYVECATAGGAEYVVSGDPHLLGVGEYRGIRFVSPATFLALLESEIL